MLWNLTKEGGWSHYKELTNKYSEALEVAIEKEGSIDDKMSCFEKIHDKIKFKAFGKVITQRTKLEQNSLKSKLRRQMKR